MTEKQDNIQTILIVDDTQANVSLLEAVLCDDYTIKTAAQGSEALEIAEEMPPDLVLLDIMMPGMDGFEVCKRFKQNPQLRDIPVIFQSSLNSAEVKAKALASGGVAYITKPFQVAEVRACVRDQLQRSSQAFEGSYSDLRWLRTEIF